LGHGYLKSSGDNSRYIMHDLAQFVSELTLEWSHNFDDSRSERDELQVLDSLRPHQSLEKLSVTTDGGTVFPPWIGDPSFTKMVELKLYDCLKVTSSMGYFQYSDST